MPEVSESEETVVPQETVVTPAEKPAPAPAMTMPETQVKPKETQKLEERLESLKDLKEKAKEVITQMRQLTSKEKYITPDKLDTVSDIFRQMRKVAKDETSEESNLHNEIEVILGTMNDDGADLGSGHTLKRVGFSRNFAVVPSDDLSKKLFTMGENALAAVERIKDKVSKGTNVDSEDKDLQELTAILKEKSISIGEDRSMEHHTLRDNIKQMLHPEGGITMEGKDGTKYELIIADNFYPPECRLEKKSK